MKKTLKKILSVATILCLATVSTVSPFTVKKEALSSAAVTGNLKRVSVHDPSIIKENGTYYIFGSHVTAAKSTDLANWTSMVSGEYNNPTDNKLYGNFSTTFAEPFQWAGDHDADQINGYGIWAPDPIYNPDYVNGDGTKGAYMIYLCTSSTACRSAIGFVTSKTIEGPYSTYGKTLIYSGFTKQSAKDNNSNIDKIYTNTNIDELIEDGTLKDGINDNWFSRNNTAYNQNYAPNAIDPTVFRDKDNKMWMTYGSWSGGIFILELDPTTGEAKYPGKNGETSDGRIIDEYFGTKISGGFWKSGEAPFILYDAEADYYYLYVTYDSLNADGGYHMRLFRSKNPDGPYTDAAGNSAVVSDGSDNIYTKGIKVMGNYAFTSMTNKYKAPGHNSAFIDDDGQRYLINHTRFDNRGEYHQVIVHQQFLNEKGWLVTAPFENRGDKISANGYSQSEIVGTYEYINHGTSSDGANVREPSAIQLNADGTVSGDASGTWEQKENSYLATFNIRGKEFNGVFFKQHDESSSHKEVMTFTAVGASNETIWGVRNDSFKSSKEVELSGSPATHFDHIDANPVLSFTYDGASNLTLSGDAAISNGRLRLTNSSTQYETYAKIPSLTGYDFSQGFTFTTDLAVCGYTSDWTPVITVGDGTPGKEGQYAFRLTQGFSAYNQPQTAGYYGDKISSPYTWDWYSKTENQNKWNTLTLTITPEKMTTYIDGVQVQTGSADYSAIFNVLKNASNNYLGASYFPDVDFNGYLDNTAIYNKALTAQEVKALTEQWASDPTPTPSATSTETPDVTPTKRPTVKPAETPSAAPTENTADTPSVAPTENPNSTPAANQENQSGKSSSVNPVSNTKKSENTSETVKSGYKARVGKTTYKVTSSASSASKTVEYKGTTSKAKSLTIPATVKIKGKTYKVTSIAAKAFKNNKKLKSIIIGKNIKKIGKQAFYHCSKLKKIKVKTKLLKKSTVGKKAFTGIYKKAVFTVPKKKKTSYKKIFRKRGAPKKIKVKF